MCVFSPTRDGGAAQATVRDLYAKKDLGLFSSNYTAIVPYHGVVALKLTPSKYVDNFDQWKPWDCGIETDTGEHGVWACFSARPHPPRLFWLHLLPHVLLPPLPMTLAFRVQAMSWDNCLLNLHSQLPCAPPAI